MCTPETMLLLFYRRFEITGLNVNPSRRCNLGTVSLYAITYALPSISGAVNRKSNHNQARSIATAPRSSTKRGERVACAFHRAPVI